MRVQDWLFLAAIAGGVHQIGSTSSGVLPTPLIPELSWVPCPLKAPLGPAVVECANVTAPLNYSDPVGNGSIQLHVRRLRSNSSGSSSVPAGDVFVLCGGPGMAQVMPFLLSPPPAPSRAITLNMGGATDPTLLRTSRAATLAASHRAPHQYKARCEGEARWSRDCGGDRGGRGYVIVYRSCVCMHSLLRPQPQPAP